MAWTNFAQACGLRANAELAAGRGEAALLRLNAADEWLARVPPGSLGPEVAGSWRGTLAGVAGMRGQLAYRRGETEQALPLLHRALATDPAHPDAPAWRRLAVAIEGRAAAVGR